MEVQLVKKELMCCKETTEVADEVAKIITFIRKNKGKPVLEIASGMVATEMMGIINAVNGADQLPVEVKSGNFIETAGYSGIVITKSLLDPIV